MRKVVLKFLVVKIDNVALFLLTQVNTLFSRHIFQIISISNSLLIIILNKREFREIGQLYTFLCGLFFIRIGSCCLDRFSLFRRGIAVGSRFALSCKAPNGTIECNSPRGRDCDAVPQSNREHWRENKKKSIKISPFLFSPYLSKINENIIIIIIITITNNPE